ncbi:hypothetical protein CBR_g8109 [Chara braunii]|uniref:Uncharacterized protein n=1 Tax=Chara braunii TaxID=69332 RepID=A0A388KL70_CHABU|nr:hypothetical protein CBR_g8109 [Chara braunii]|eukprot:GBG70809.1 hypothetical protein CBR_g8109 [Chara braunii]
MRCSRRRNGIVIAASRVVVLHRAHATYDDDADCGADDNDDDDDDEDGGVVDDYDDVGDDDDDGVDDVVDDDEDDDDDDDDDGVDNDDNDDDDDDDHLVRNGGDLLDTTNHGVDVLDTTDDESRDAHSHGRTISSLHEIRALCGGCESNGAAGEGGDLGSGEATHVQREDARGLFDDSEDEATPRPPFSTSRERDWSVLSIPGVRQEVAADPREEAVQCGSDLEPGEGHGADDKAVGGEGPQGTPQKRRGDCQEDVVSSSKKQKTRTPKTTGEKRKGKGVEEDHPGSKRPASKQKQPASGPSTTRPVIDVDAGYFLEYKDGVRTRRDFEISPAQIVDLGEWEDLYNQRSLDPVLVETIKEAMQYAFENKKQTYELPIFKLAPLGLQKPTPGTKPQRLKPEEWKDELVGEYYYYAVCGQHNAAAARSLLGSEVAKKYNFERWPARMPYFSDDDFEGYFLVSSQNNKKDLKAPPRQLKLSMKDIRWKWKHDGCPRAVMGHPSGKQDQVLAWRKFCTTVLHKAPHINLWILADQKEEEALKKQNVALRSYFPLAMAGGNVWKLALEFFEKWETGKKEKEEGDWFVQVPDPNAHCWKAMESLTDNEKCRVLKKVLASEVVWVQAGSPSLVKLGKLSVQDMVQLVKCDRLLLRLWNYYQFKHGKRSDADWIQRYPFMKSRSAVFRKFESQGLDDELWDNSRKHVSDSALFKDFPPYLGCNQDNSIEVTEKSAGHKKLSVDWRNKVLSVLNESRVKSREVAISPSRTSRRISIDKVIDGILGDHNVSARLFTMSDNDETGNVTSPVAVALASSPPKSLVLPATLAAGEEGEVGGRQHVTSSKKSRVGGQALDVLALPTPNSPSKERREKQTGKP